MYDDIDDDHYKPKNSAFNNNYIKYQSDVDKGKTLSIKEYLYMIRQYLSDIINVPKHEWKI